MYRLYNEHILTAHELNQQVTEPKMYLVHKNNEDPRRHNEPLNASHLDIVFVGPEGQPPNVQLRVYGQSIDY